MSVLVYNAREKDSMCHTIVVGGGVTPRCILYDTNDVCWREGDRNALLTEAEHVFF